MPLGGASQPLRDISSESDEEGGLTVRALVLTEAQHRSQRKAVTLGLGALSAALVALAALLAVAALTAPPKTAEGRSDRLVRLVASASASTASCHTASAGEPCFDDVQWARQVGIHEHPEWYRATCPMLQVGSTFEEFQACVFKTHRTTCTLPCNPAEANQEPVVEVHSQPIRSHHHPTPCHIATKGERCYENVMRVMAQGLADKQLRLAPNSTFEEVQARLHQLYPAMGCPPPCECHTATESETCYAHVSWALREGLAAHPAWYPGLSPDASFEDVQAYLRKDQRHECPMPCRATRPAMAGALGSEESSTGTTTTTIRQPKAPTVPAAAAAAAPKTATHAEPDGQASARASSPTSAGEDRAVQHVSTTAAGVHNATTKEARQHAAEGLGTRQVAREGEQHEVARPTMEAASKRQGAEAEKRAPDSVAEQSVPPVHQQPCHTAAEGEQCWRDLAFAMSEGIYSHPEWYPNLTQFSSPEDFQQVLHANKALRCAEPCPCHTAQPGEECHDNIRWVLREGIASHPEWYEGLTVRSRFEAVQRRLHEDAHSPCGIPCTPKVWGNPSLFCFSVFRSQGYEVELVRAQVDKGVGIFRCDEFSVLSDQVLDLAKGIKTTIIPPCETVGVSKDGTAANTLVFMQAWSVIFEDARWRAHDWVIKADPDAVILADRMRAHLLPHTGKNTWMTNCMKYTGPGWPMMFGSLEAFSNEALETYYAGAQRCRDELQWQAWGEDLFMGNCLSFLGATSTFDGGLIGDNVCKGANCADGTTAAYHPFKSVDSWFQCYNQAVR